MDFLMTYLYFSSLWAGPGPSHTAGPSWASYCIYLSMLCFLCCSWKAEDLPCSPCPKMLSTIRAAHWFPSTSLNAPCRSSSTSTNPDPAGCSSPRLWGQAIHQTLAPFLSQKGGQWGLWFLLSEGQPLITSTASFPQPWVVWLWLCVCLFSALFRQNK